jgi:hypothetical protein
MGITSQEAHVPALADQGTAYPATVEAFHSSPSRLTGLGSWLLVLKTGVRCVGGWIPMEYVVMMTGRRLWGETTRETTRMP